MKALRSEWAKIKRNKILSVGILVFMVCLVSTSNIQQGAAIMIVFVIFMAMQYLAKRAKAKRANRAVKS